MDPDRWREINEVLNKGIRGALTDTIHQHGPITKDNLVSATKRVHGQVKAILKEKLGNGNAEALPPLTDDEPDDTIQLNEAPVSQGGTPLS